MTEEDHRIIFRWIDLGCPIDLASTTGEKGSGRLDDEIHPTLTVSLSGVADEKTLSRILVGMHDIDTGLDMDSFRVVADFAVAGVPAGKNPAAKFKRTSDGAWELKLATPIHNLPRGRLTVSVRDRQGTVTRVERMLSVR